MVRRLSLTIFAAVIQCMSLMARGQESPTFAPGWNPSEFQLSMDGPCSFELTKASVLLKLSDSGQSREKVSSELPSDTGASALIVTSILEDIYENPAVAHEPYFVYRNITCMRRHLGKSTPPTLVAVAPQVMTCQRVFGIEITDHLISCIQHAVAGEER
jgi:hypothetical protein